MNFIWNNYFVLQTLLSSKISPFAAITALQKFSILAVNLLRSSEEISPHCFLKHLPQVGLAWWALLTYYTVKLLPQQLNRVEIWWLRWPVHYSQNTNYIFFSIKFYLYCAFNKGALSQSCFTENRPPMSKARATVARKNSLADNRKKPWAEPDSEGNHLPLVGTGFSPIYWVHFESSGRTRMPSWSRLDLRARRGRSGDLG